METNMDKLINTYCDLTAYHIENLEKTKQQIENTLQQLKNHNKRGQQLMLVQTNEDRYKIKRLGVKTRSQRRKIEELEMRLRYAYAHPDDSANNKMFITSDCDHVKNMVNIDSIEINNICLEKKDINGPNKSMKKIKLDHFDSRLSTIINKNRLKNKFYHDRVIALKNTIKNFKHLMPEVSFAINEESAKFDYTKSFKFNNFCKVIFDICSYYEIQCRMTSSRVSVSNFQ